MVVRGEEGEFRLYWPEVGGIGLLLTLPLVYYLVSVATPILLNELALVAPGIVPEPTTTIMAVLLWAAAALAMAYTATTDLLVTVRRFDTRQEVSEYLASVSMPRRRLLTILVRAVGGAALVVVSFEGFVVAYRKVVRATVIDPETFRWPFTVGDGIWFFAFLGGFVLLVGGVDRLVVDGVRRYLRRRAVETDA